VPFTKGQTKGSVILITTGFPAQYSTNDVPLLTELGITGCGDLGEEEELRASAVVSFPGAASSAVSSSSPFCVL
jgi:hypothetical protein